MKKAGPMMAKCRFVAWIAMFACLSAVTAAETQNLASLNIEGQGIKQLILKDQDGRTRTFESPGPMVTLPPGNYTVHTIRLEGDHYAQSHRLPAELQVIADPNAPATLKIGAPLRQVVKVERQGPVMALSYELVGQGGEPYAISRNRPEQRPAFTVYKGDRKVASGDFEFG